MKKRTVYNLLLFAFVLAFFVTPLGFEAKVLLQRIFAGRVEVLPQGKTYKIDPDWRLKDRDNRQFSFEKSNGRVRLVYFWSSWRTNSLADLESLQKLYNQYGNQVDFYVITNELPEPVEKTLHDRKLTLPITYLIIGEKMPFDPETIPSGYIIDKNNVVRAQTHESANWNSIQIKELLTQLLNS